MWRFLYAQARAKEYVTDVTHGLCSFPTKFDAHLLALFNKYYDKYYDKYP